MLARKNSFKAGRLNSSGMRRVFVGMAVAGAASFAAGHAARGATATWVGATGASWTTPGSWNPSTDLTVSLVDTLFNTSVSVAGLVVTPTVNSIVGTTATTTNLTVNSLVYNPGSSTNVTFYQDIGLYDGSTLTITGAATSAALWVGGNGNAGRNTGSTDLQQQLYFGGDGTGNLNIQSPTGNIRVGMQTSSSGNNGTLDVLLDLTNLNTVTANVNNVFLAVATATGGEPTGSVSDRNSDTLALPIGATSSAVITANTIKFGSTNRAQNFLLGTSTTLDITALTLGAAGTSANAPNNTSVRVNTATTANLIKIRATDGVSGAAMTVQNSVTDFSTNVAANALDVLASTLKIGNGYTTSTLIFGTAADTSSSTSLLSANSITIGANTNSLNANATVSSTLTVNGGKVVSSSGITVGAGGSNAILTLNNNASLTVSSGGVTIGQNGAGSGTGSIINAGDGLMTLNANSIANVTGNITLGGIPVGAGTSGTGSVVLNGTSSLSLNGSIAVANATSNTKLTIAGGTLNMNSGTIGAGTPLTSVTMSAGGLQNFTSLAATTVNYTGGTVTNAGSITATAFVGGTAAAALNMGASALTITGTANTSATGLTLTLGAGGKLDASNTGTANSVSLNGLVLANGANLNLDVGNGQADAVALLGSGTLSLTGTTNISLVTFGTVGPGTIPLLSYSGTPTINGAGSTAVAAALSLLTAAPSGLNWSLVDGTNVVNLVITAQNGWSGAALDGGKWNTPGNWVGPVPINTGDSASFADSGVATYNVNVDGPVTVGTLSINATGSYAIGGANSITLAQTTATPAILSVGGATQTLSAPLVFNNDVTATITSTLKLVSQVTGPGILTKLGAGKLQLGSATALQNTTLVLSGGTFDVNGFSATLGGLAGTVGLDLEGTNLSIGNNGTDTSYSGVLSSSSGTGSITKIGAGMLTLRGSNTFTGGVTLNAGKLNINSDANLGAGTAPISFTGSSTLQVTATVSLAAGRNLSIADGVTATIDSSTFNVTIPGIISGSGGLTKSGTGVFVLTGTNSYLGTTTLSGGVLRADDGVGLPAASALSLTGAVLETDANLTRPLGTAAGQVFIGAGTSGFSANGAPVMVTIGTAGDVLTWGSANFSPTALVLNATTANNTLTLQNGLDLNGAAAAVNVNANSATLTGLLTDTSGNPQSFTKGGSGTFVLTSFSYAGAVTITGGVVRPSNGLMLQNNAVSLTGGTLDLTGFPATTMGSLAGTTALDLKGTALTVGANNSSTSYNGVITNSTGTGSITKTGTGTWTLSGGTNAYTGGTLINGGGTITMSDTASLSNALLGSGAVTLDNGTLELNSSSVNNPSPTYLTFSNPLVVNTTGTLWGITRGDMTSSLTGNGVLTYRANFVRGTISGNWSNFTGTIDVIDANNSAGNEFRLNMSTANSPINANIVVQTSLAHITAGVSGTYNLGALSGTGTLGGASVTSGGTVNSVFSIGNLGLNDEFDGTIVNNSSGSTSIIKVGGGAWTIGGNNSYSGTTTLNGGKIIVNSGSPFGTGNFTLTTGTLDLNGFGFTLKNLTGTGGVITNNAPFEVFLSVNETATGTFAGVIQDGSGSIALDKTGTASLVLTGSNNYTGTTEIDQGTLVISSLSNIGNGAGGILFFGGTLRVTGTSLTTIDNVSSVNWSFFSGGLDIATSTNVFTAGQNIGGGPFTKSGAGALLLTGTNTYGGGTTVNQGLLVINSAANRPSGDALTINDANASGGKVVIQGDASNIANYRPNLQVGYNLGTWNDPTSNAITSTTATAANLQAIGYMKGSDYLLLHGANDFFSTYTVLPTDVLLRYTYMGDATLDGQLTVADYAQIDSAFLLGGTTADWMHGDFNYDGVIDYQDYALIDAAFALHGAALAQSEIDTHTAEFGAPYLAALNAAMGGAVPEPASLLLLSVGALGLLRRRR